MGRTKNKPVNSSSLRQRSFNTGIVPTESQNDGDVDKKSTTTTVTESGKESLDDFSYGKVSSSSKRSKSRGHGPGGPVDVKTEVPQKEKEDLGIDEEGNWSPTPYSAFKLLISARFAAALWTTISDCDETYNYWEPMHYLMYGKGFQTWEYSPDFALRSYTYILFHAVPAKFYQFILKPNSLLVFFFVRCMLAFICGSAETYLYKAVRKRLGGNISRILLVTSIFSSGMFISSTAFLPSSFSAYCVAITFGAWLNSKYELAIFTVALSTLLSWPFAALTGVFIAFDIVFIQRKYLRFITFSVISLVVILLPIIGIDSYYYGKLVIPPLNIVSYNIFSSKGPDLYGTEPWTFYIVNGILNFNIIYLFALISPFCIIIGVYLLTQIREKLLIVGTFYLWLGVFIMQPHKEERFLFPVYPLIPLCGAIGIDCLQKFMDLLFSKALLKKLSSVQDLSKAKVWDFRRLVTTLGVMAIILSSFIGCSRILALHYGYRGPFDIYFKLHRHISLQEPLNEDVEFDFNVNNMTLCYGKEWHRFPTSFFLPDPSWNVRFIRSEFKGQLPNIYSSFDINGTRKIPQNMNDDNKEEVSRYVELSECNLLMDLVDYGGKVTQLEPNYSLDNETWFILYEQPFLNSAKSDKFFRAFYIPWFSDQYTRYDRYMMLGKVQKKVKNKSRKSSKKNKSSSTKSQKESKNEQQNQRKIGREFDDDGDEEFDDPLQGVDII